jgi:hypothetical protein
MLRPTFPEEGTLASKMQRNSRRQNMMTKTTVALAAALFLAVGTAGQAGEHQSHERQGLGFSFHTGPLGQPLGDRQPGSWADYPQAEPYGYVPRHEHIRHHRLVR